MTMMGPGVCDTPVEARGGGEVERVHRSVSLGPELLRQFAQRIEAIGELGGIARTPLEPSNEPSNVTALTTTVLTPPPASQPILTISCSGQETPASEFAADKGKKLVAEGKERKFIRGENWGFDDTMALIKAKRQEVDELRCGGPSAKMRSAAVKWAIISAKVKSFGFDRDGDKCAKRWNNIFNLYKRIIEYQSKPGVQDFWSLSREQRKGVGICSHVDRGCFDAMNVFLRKRGCAKRRNQVRVYDSHIAVGSADMEMAEEDMLNDNSANESDEVRRLDGDLRRHTADRSSDSRRPHEHFMTMPKAIADLSGAMRDGAEGWTRAFLSESDRQAAHDRWTREHEEKKFVALRDLGREQNEVLRENGKLVATALATIAESINNVARSLSGNRESPSVIGSNDSNRGPGGEEDGTR